MLRTDGYRNELEDYVNDSQALFSSYRGCSFFVSGAAGLIGSYLADLLIVASRRYNLGIHVCACDRDAQRLMARYPDEYSDIVERLVADVCTDELPNRHFDYVVHAASNTSPIDYAKKPIDTIWTNIGGAKRLLDLTVSGKAKRYLFCSSVEAYGRNNGDIDKFTEDYSGYVDSNTLRANYPTSKRCVEALCNAYASEYPGLEFVIARIGRFFGPTVIPGDSKAPTQFIGNAVRGDDIVLKSDGTQLYSWGYVGDCATALLTILARGENGGAYNVADPDSCAMLKDFAAAAAKESGGGLTFVKQSETELAGYSKITKATLDVSKLLALGWTAKHHLRDGIGRTVKYFKEVGNVPN